MKQITRRCLLVALAVLVTTSVQSVAGTLSDALSKVSAADSICLVWVRFADKPSGLAKARVSSDAALRRTKSGYPAVSLQDAPISGKYLAEVRQKGATLRHLFKWQNAASFSVRASALESIASLPFVAEVFEVKTFHSKGGQKGMPKTVSRQPSGAGIFGELSEGLSQLAVPEAQQYLIEEKSALPGDGVLIAVFDAGFWLENACFDRMLRTNQIVADSDFVDGVSQPYYVGESHGTHTLSLIGGYDPGRFMGVAWNARFLLARTENSEPEEHVEEDNWAAAVVWAESLGVDIVSSSLGYLDYFDDSVKIGDTVVVDYPFSFLDGKTTIVSAAAYGAVQRGVLVVNAMGNHTDYLTPPADVEDVISVSAVRIDGKIASFVSPGPTFTGVRKPDVVALGVNVPLPFQTGGGYGVGDGTSFATPLVAGVVALIKQQYPLESAAQIRQRLYAHCALSSYQDSVDGVYGRGYPQALASMLAPGETYTANLDSLKLPVENTFYVFLNDTTGEPITQGEIFVRGQAETSFRQIDIQPDGSTYIPNTAEEVVAVYAEATGYTQSSLVYTTLTLGPDTMRIVMRDADLMGTTASLRVRITDTSGSPVRLGHVYSMPENKDQFTSYPIDSTTGLASISNVSSGRVVLYAAAPGYVTSSKVEIRLNGMADTLALVMQPRPAEIFAVYPNVIHRKDLKANPSLGVHIDFLASPDKPVAYSQSCKIAIRQVDGKIIWKHSSYLDEYAPVRDKVGKPLAWDCRQGNRIVEPGTYILMLSYADKTRTKKILIRP